MAQATSAISNTIKCMVKASTSMKMVANLKENLKMVLWKDRVDLLMQTEMKYMDIGNKDNILITMKRIKKNLRKKKKKIR